MSILPCWCRMLCCVACISCISCNVPHVPVNCVHHSASHVICHSSDYMSLIRSRLGDTVWSGGVWTAIICINPVLSMHPYWVLSRCRFWRHCKCQLEGSMAIMSPLHGQHLQPDSWHHDVVSTYSPTLQPDLQPDSWHRRHILHVRSASSPSSHFLKQKF